MVEMKDTSTKKKLDEATKAKLEEVIKELFSQQNFHQVQMRNIAKKTGIGLNTIYLHYESKERLLFSFIGDWIQGIDDRIVEHLQGLEDVKEKIRKVIWVLLDFYDRNPDIGRILLFTVPFKTWSTDETFSHKDLSSRIIAIFKEGQAKGVLDTTIPAEFMFDILYGVIHRAVYISFYKGNQECLTAHINLFHRVLWRAIEAPAGA